MLEDLLKLAVKFKIEELEPYICKTEIIEENDSGDILLVNIADKISITVGRDFIERSAEYKTVSIFAIYIHYILNHYNDLKDTRRWLAKRLSVNSYLERTCPDLRPLPQDYGLPKNRSVNFYYKNLKKEQKQEPYAVVVESKPEIEPKEINLLNKESPIDLSFIEGIVKRHQSKGFLYTMKRQSRRLGEGFPRKVFKKEAELAIIVDVSASMSPYLEEVFSYLNYIYKKYKIKLYICDNHIVYEGKNIPEKVGGLRGTDLVPAFDKVDKKDMVLCITDGRFGESKIDINPYWIIINNEDFTTNYGTVKHIKYIDTIL